MNTTQGAGLGALGTCPECGSARLSAVSDGESTNFFCESCASCWLVSMDWVKRVDPLTCPGCGRQAECLARLAAQGKPDVEPSDTR